MLNILLIFHAARNDNLGVGALTESEVAILRSVSQSTGVDLRITIIDGKSVDRRPVYITGPDIEVSETRILRHPIEFYRTARRADLVIDIGAGDSFTDIYGSRRIITLLLLKYLTLLARRPLILAPQTIGPFESPLFRLLARFVIRKSTIVCTRDALSTVCARELEISRDIIESSDVALRLPYTPTARNRQTGKIKVGLNVSGLLMSGGYTGKNMFRLRVDYSHLIRNVISGFINHKDKCEVHLVPHVISWEGASVEDDYTASLKLAEEFSHLLVAPKFETPSEAKSYISGLDFFLGARMHSCIAAFSSGVPVVPMAYSRKFSGLFGSLGYNYTVDCTTDDENEILRRIFDAYEQRDSVAKEVQVALALGQKKLGEYEKALHAQIMKMV